MPASGFLMQIDWQKNIPLLTRSRVFFRDSLLRYVHNPIQVFRRKNGYADKDIFKSIKIQTNYRCTRKCSYCHYGQANPPINRELDEQLFYRIIDQLRSMRYRGRLGLFEINEPLTDKRLPLFIRHTRSLLADAWIYLTTNGDLLKDGSLETLFKEGVNSIYLNSYDEKAFVRNRRFYNNLPSGSKKLVTHIDRTYQTTWNSRAGNIKEFQGRTCSNPCDLVYDHCYIKPDGKVYSCINDFCGINEMGDLHTDSLLAIWHGDRFTRLRQQLNNGNRAANPLCSQCDYIGYSSLPRTPLQWTLRNLLSSLTIQQMPGNTPFPKTAGAIPTSYRVTTDDNE